jgi:hypothetical protein
MILKMEGLKLLMSRGAWFSGPWPRFSQNRSERKPAESLPFLATNKPTITTYPQKKNSSISYHLIVIKSNLNIPIYTTRQIQVKYNIKYPINIAIHISLWSLPYIIKPFKTINIPIVPMAMDVPIIPYQASLTKRTKVLKAIRASGPRRDDWWRLGAPHDFTNPLI